MAAYIFNFTQNIQWRNEKTIERFRFKVITRNTRLVKELQKITFKKKVRGKPVTVMSEERLTYTENIQLIFIAREREELIPKIFSIIEGKNILLITENYADKKIVMINFRETKEDTIEFEINKANIINQNLTVLLDMVLLGGTEIDVAKLYKESQDRLRLKEKELAVLQRRLDSLNAKISESNKEIAGQNREIQQQKKEIALGKTVLKRQQEAIDSQKKVLEEQGSTIAIQKILLYLLIVIVLLASGLLYNIYRGYKSKLHSEERIEKLNRNLQKRAIALEEVNNELEAFAYSVSHDLRAPLRHIAGFMELLRNHIESDLDEKDSQYMTNVVNAANRMKILIDELLSFSRMGRQDIHKKQFNLGALVEEVRHELEPDTRDREIRWHIADLPDVNGDRALLKVVLVNLLGNAVKFTQTRPVAEIKIECQYGKEMETIIVIRDNGVGFDMAYADKLFGVFQRLHHQSDFEGTGIGLANVQRIILRHGGRVWAEGKKDGGAAFYFSLPRPDSKNNEKD
jgi:signal transduction histidine kinase